MRFEDIITTEDQAEVEDAKQQIELARVYALLLALHIKQFLRARLPESDDDI